MSKVKIQDKTVKLLTLICPMIYFASYLTRKNYGVILDAIISAGLLDEGRGGSIESLALISYGAGQIISGILGDKFKPQNIILCGLTTTTVCNLLMPFCPGYTAMAVVWFINGFAQSMLWPPLVRIMAATMDKDTYNDVCVNVNVAGISGTILLYLTSSLIWLRFPVFENVSWKMTFFSSSAVCLIILIVWLLAFRKINSEKHLFENKTKKAEKTEKTAAPRLSAKVILVSGFILIALGIILQGMLRDGVTDWVPTFMRKTFNIQSEDSILMAVALPIFGVVSLKVIGFVNRKFVKNEVKGAALTFVISTLCCLFLYFFYEKNQWVTLLVASLVVGCMHAINFFLVCIVPSKFEKYGIVSTMSGIINSMTYVGSAAALGGFGLVSKNFGWDACVAAWCVIAALGTVVCFIAAGPWKKFNKADE